MSIKTAKAITSYISDLAKMKTHYPAWDITKTLDDVFQEIYQASLIQD
ncbi:hypothetical protein BH11VER1_BH11VER1_10940 [soil metagenome]